MNKLTLVGALSIAHQLKLSSDVTVVDAYQRNKRFDANTIGCHRCVAADFYTGTAEGLIKAGLIEWRMLPGQPGHKKTVSEFPVAEGAVGVRRIRKVSATRYNVQVTIPVHERQNRERQQDLEYRRAMQARERPPSPAIVVARGKRPLVIGREPADLTTNEILLLNRFRAMEDDYAGMFLNMASSLLEPDANKSPTKVALRLVESVEEQRGL